MTDYKQLCAKVLAYYEGQGEYDFSNLGAIARDNAAFDAWQEISNELKSALSEPEPGESPQPVPVLPEGTPIIEPPDHTLLAPIAQPIPVSKRLPGPEDCDAQGRCWHFAPAEGFGAAGWSFYQGSEDDTHWLPAHTLPLPTTSRSI